MKLETLTGEVIDLATLKNDSIIVVKGVRSRDAQEELINYLRKAVPVNAAFLVFGNQPDASLEIVPEEKMNELGWHRNKLKDFFVRWTYRVKKLFQRQPRA